MGTHFVVLDGLGLQALACEIHAGPGDCTDFHAPYPVSKTRLKTLRTRAKKRRERRAK